MATVLISLVLPATPASAAYYSGGNGSASFTVEISGVNQTWSGYLIGAPGVWNNAGAETNISVGPSATKKMTAGNFPGETWLGLYSPAGTRANRSFVIQHNANRLTEADAASPGTYAQWIRYVSIHELGHALSQDDNPTTGLTSIMKYPSTSSVPFQTPRPYDVGDVLARY